MYFVHEIAEEPHGSSQRINYMYMYNLEDLFAIMEHGYALHPLLLDCRRINEILQHNENEEVVRLGNIIFENGVFHAKKF